MLTIDHIAQAARDDRWLGFGYLAGRSYLLTEGSDTGYDPELVARIDAQIIDHANHNGWTYEDLFAWANSKNGRWAADSLFSGTSFTQVVKWGLMIPPTDR